MSGNVRKRQHSVNMAGERPARAPAGDAFSLLAIQVLRLSGLLTAAGDSLARTAGQTSARWQVLAAVEEAPMPVAQIARTLGLARQSVQRIADVLADEALIVYADNPDHRRAKLVRLTARGRSTLATIQSAQRPWADTMGAGIGEGDLRRATAVLDRVLEALANVRADND